MSQEEKQSPEQPTNPDETAVSFKINATDQSGQNQDSLIKDAPSIQIPLMQNAGASSPASVAPEVSTSDGFSEIAPANPGSTVTPLQVMQSQSIPIIKSSDTVISNPTSDNLSTVQKFQEMPSQPISIMGAAKPAEAPASPIPATSVQPGSVLASQAEKFQEMPSQPISIMGATGSANQKQPSSVSGISLTGQPITGTPIAPITASPSASSGATSGTPITPLTSGATTSSTPIAPLAASSSISSQPSVGASLTSQPISATSAASASSTATPITPITPLVPPTTISPSTSISTNASATQKTSSSETVGVKIPIISDSSGQTQPPLANVGITETASKMPVYTYTQPVESAGEITHTHNPSLSATQPVTNGGDVTVSVRQINPGTTVIQPITATPTTATNSGATSSSVTAATSAPPASVSASNTAIPASQVAGQIPTWMTTSVSATRFNSGLTPAQQIRRALSLSSVLVELRSRVIEANIRGPEKMVTSISDGYWLSSTWRGLFLRAVTLHAELLGDFEVDLTRYNMSFGRPRYLNAGFAFVNIGTEPTGVKFSIAEKLRQTLNFLTALYQKHELWDEIVEQIYSGTDPFLQLPQGKDKYLYLIEDLTEQVDALINAWDNYVRERLFATSTTMLSARYAYAAGRALTELSWNITIKTAPYRDEKYRATYLDKATLANDVYQHWIEAFHPQNVGYLQRQLSALINVLEEEFLGVQATEKRVLDKSDIAQQESNLRSPRACINSIIQSLEYWQTTVAELSKNGVIQRVTVKQVSDYREMPSWNETFELHPDWSYENLMDLRLALIEAWSSWFALVSGRQDLTSFRAVNVASELLQDYSQQITRMASGNLQQAFREMQEEVVQLASAGVNATKQVAKAGIGALGDVLKSKWLWIGLGTAVITVIVIGVVIAFAQSNGKTPDFSTILATIGSTLLGALGIGAPGAKAVRDGQQKVAATGEAGAGDIVSKTNSARDKLDQSANVGALVLTTVGQVREYLEQAFTKGFDQLQKELSLISATLAVTSPLVEWVTRNCDTQNDLEFLSTVIWNDRTRRSQLNRIVIAAFGPVGAFFIASSNAKRSETETATSLEVPVTEYNLK